MQMFIYIQHPTNLFERLPSITMPYVLSAGVSAITKTDPISALMELTAVCLSPWMCWAVSKITKTSARRGNLWPCAAQALSLYSVLGMVLTAQQMWFPHLTFRTEGQLRSRFKEGMVKVAAQRHTNSPATSGEWERPLT